MRNPFSYFVARRQAAIDRELSRIRKLSEIRLNLGCGEHPMSGFINVDLFSDKADIRADVLDLKPYAADSVDLVENHHLFEHLSFEDSGRALREWHRVLRRDGYLVITCPNLTWVAVRWLCQTLLGAVGFKTQRDGTERMFYGPQTNPGMFHRAGYDRSSILKLLHENGFRSSLVFTPYPERPTPSMIVIAVKV